MFSLAKLPRAAQVAVLLPKVPGTVRPMTGQAQAAMPKAEGDISSVFTSLSGTVPKPLPERFAAIKRQLIQGNEARLAESWKTLLKRLAVENEIVWRTGPNVIPQIEFEDLKNASENFTKDIRKRGVAVIRNVIPENVARGYKTEVEDYVKKNPATKGEFVSS